MNPALGRDSSVNVFGCFAVAQAVSTQDKFGHFPVRHALEWLRRKSEMKQANKKELGVMRLRTTSMTEVEHDEQERHEIVSFLQGLYPAAVEHYDIMRACGGPKSYLGQATEPKAYFEADWEAVGRLAPECADALIFPDAQGKLLG